MKWFSKKEKKEKKKKNVIREYVESFGVAIIAALILKALVIEHFVIPSGSMEDTLLVGDFLFVNKFVYGARIPFTDIKLPELREPKQNDKVVFKYPGDKNHYIKRVIATEGQTVEIKNKVVYVDGREVPFPSHGKLVNPTIKPPGIQDPDIYPPGAGNSDNYGPVTIPNGALFGMGDNRDNSIDSRHRGFLLRKNIVGKALIITFSWNKEIPLYQIFRKLRWKRFLRTID